MSWAQELDLMQNELIKSLNGALGDTRVEGLRLVVGEALDLRHT